MTDLPDIASKYEEIKAKKYSYSELSKLNPYIDQADEDILYHLCLGNKSHDLPKMFGDVKFVVMGSTPKRMEQFAYFIMHEIGCELPSGTILNDISKSSHRYAMFKVGPVLSVSHGMGMASIGILLHELIKLMYHAKVKDPTFIRIGTCGGFATQPGTVVLTEKVVNDNLESVYELLILGSKVEFPCNLNEDLIKEFSSLAKSADFPTVVGITHCTNDFYEGSARTDGAICKFSVEESLEYYGSLQKNGVVNVDMESMAFAAFTSRAGIKSIVVTAILCDRLESNQVKQSKEVLEEWQARPNQLVAQYIKSKLNVKSDSFRISPSQVTTMPSICAPCDAALKSMENERHAPTNIDTHDIRTRPCVPVSCPRAWSDSSKSGTPHTSSSSPNSSEFGSTWRNCYKKCTAIQETTTSDQQKAAAGTSAYKTSHTSGNSSTVPGTSPKSKMYKTDECAPPCITSHTSSTSGATQGTSSTSTTHKTDECTDPCKTPPTSSTSGSVIEISATLKPQKTDECAPSCKTSNAHSNSGAIPKTSSTSATHSTDECAPPCKTPHASSTTGVVPETSVTSKTQRTDECAPSCKTPYTSTGGVIPKTSATSKTFKTDECAPACRTPHTSSSSGVIAETSATSKTYKTDECSSPCKTPYTNSTNGAVSETSTTSKMQKSDECAPPCKTSNSHFNNGAVPGNSTSNTNSKTTKCAPACVTSHTSRSSDADPETSTSSTHKTVECTPACITSPTGGKDSNSQYYAAGHTATQRKRSSITKNKSAKLDCLHPCSAGLRVTPTEPSHSAQVDGKSTFKCSQKCNSKGRVNSRASADHTLSHSEIPDGCNHQECGTESEETPGISRSKDRSDKFLTAECYKKCAKRKLSLNGTTKQSSFESAKESQNEDVFNETSPCCVQREDTPSPAFCLEQYEYIKERQSQELEGTTVTPVLTLESRVVENESESGPCCSHSTEVKSEENPTSVGEGIGSCCAAKTHSSNLPKDSPETPDTETKPSSSSTTELPSDHRTSCPWTVASCKLKQDNGQIVESSAVPVAKQNHSTNKVSLEHKAGCPWKFSTCHAKHSDKVVDPSETPGSTLGTQPLHEDESIRSRTKSVTLPESADWAGICCTKIRKHDPSTATTTATRSRKSPTNKQDASRDLCNACKNLQEKIMKASRSIVSHSQHKKVKCQHKLKRLEKRFQGRH